MIERTRRSNATLIQVCWGPKYRSTNLCGHRHLIHFSATSVPHQSLSIPVRAAHFLSKAHLTRAFVGSETPELLLFLAMAVDADCLWIPVGWNPHCCAIFIIFDGLFGSNSDPSMMTLLWPSLELKGSSFFGTLVALMQAPIASMSSRTSSFKC